MFCSLMGSYVAFSSSLTFLLPTLTSVRTGHLYRIALFDLLTAVPCLVTFRPTLNYCAFQACDNN